MLRALAGGSSRNDPRGGLAAAVPAPHGHVALTRGPINQRERVSADAPWPRGRMDERTSGPSGALGVFWMSFCFK